MSTFKKGDEVVLIPRVDKWEYLYPCYTDEMVECCKRGEVFVIMAMPVCGHIPVSRDSFPWRQWFVREEWIDHYVERMEND